MPVPGPAKSSSGQWVTFSLDGTHKRFEQLVVSLPVVIVNFAVTWSAISCATPHWWDFTFLIPPAIVTSPLFFCRVKGCFDALDKKYVS